MNRKILLCIILSILLAVLLYGGGVVGQFVGNYLTWQQNGGVPGDGTSPPFPSFAFFDCLATSVSSLYGLAGVLICAAALAVLLFLMLRSDGSGGILDKERNFHMSYNHLNLVC